MADFPDDEPEFPDDEMDVVMPGEVAPGTPKQAVYEPAPPEPPEIDLDGPEADAEDDAERAMLSEIIPGSDGPTLRTEALRLMRVQSALGHFTAGRLLKKPDREGSELLHHRAKVAFVDGAALAVPMLMSELGSKKPNKQRIDGCLAVIKAAGIAVDSVPVSSKQREKEMAEDREAANASPAELRQRINDRLAKMRLEATGSKGAKE